MVCYGGASSSYFIATISHRENTRNCCNRVKYCCSFHCCSNCNNTIGSGPDYNSPCGSFQEVDKKEDVSCHTTHLVIILTMLAALTNPAECIWTITPEELNYKRCRIWKYHSRSRNCKSESIRFSSLVFFTVQMLPQASTCDYKWVRDCTTSGMLTTGTPLLQGNIIYILILILIASFQSKKIHAKDIPLPPLPTKREIERYKTKRYY